MDNQNLHIKVVTESKFKTTAVCLMLRRPLTRREATLNALLAGVLSAGCKKYNSISAINTYMEELYGAVFDGQVIKKGEYQVLRFYIEVVSTIDGSLFNQAVAFLKQIILEPFVGHNGFNAEIVENEKHMLENLIKSRINDKNEYVLLKCVEAMCKNEAFGIFGDGYAEELNEIDNQSLYEHYKKVIEQTPLEFIIIGNIEADAAERTIRNIFDATVHLPIKLPENEILYNEKAPTIVEEKTKVGQGKICIGVRVNTTSTGENFYALLMYNEILGGGGNSRLFVNVREKNSLCYAINSFIYRAKAMLMIQCGVEEENIQLTIEKINEQIKLLKSGDISNEEVAAAKQSLVSNFEITKDNPGAMLDFYYTQFILGDYANIDAVINGIRTVDKEQIIKIARDVYTDMIYILKGDE